MSGLTTIPAPLLTQQYIKFSSPMNPYFLPQRTTMFSIAFTASQNYNRGITAMAALQPKIY